KAGKPTSGSNEATMCDFSSHCFNSNRPGCWCGHQQLEATFFRLELIPDRTFRRVEHPSWWKGFGLVDRDWRLKLESLFWNGLIDSDILVNLFGNRGEIRILE